MKLVGILLTAACGVSLVTASAGKAASEPQQQCSVKKTISKTVQGRYLLYLPQDYDRDKHKRWPLVMFLHGAGERGDDMEKVKVHGPPKLVAAGKQLPFILVSPQCPEDSIWENERDTLTVVLDEAEKKFRVDKDREYLTGISMGGYGVWTLAAMQPRRFAAIAPISGGGRAISAPLIKDIPMWVFHGEKDPIVSPARSQEMVDAVKAAGGNPRFTLYPGVEHDAWTATYNSDEFWRWLLDQRRSQTAGK